MTKLHSEQPVSIQSPNRLIAKLVGQVPLRTVLIVPFVLQIVGTVGLVGYLSFKSGQSSVKDLAYQLIDEVDERVEQNLQHHLDVPKHVNQSLAAAIRTRVLDWKNASGLERYFAQQLQIYGTVSSVAIATEQKEFLAVEKSLASDSFVIRVLGKSTGYAFHYYAADRQGKRIKLTKVRHDYNPQRDPPHGRPWYQAAHEAGQAIWLPVVNLSQGVDRPILTIVNFLPFDDSDGKFQGVLASSLFLPQFAHFLDSLKVGKTGQVFIIDRQGLLIASSSGETPFKKNLDSNYLKNLNPQEWRVVARNSRNSLTQASVNFLLTHVKNLHQIEQKKNFTFDFKNKRYFLQIKPIQDNSGLDWLTLVVVPESNFMTQIHANTRTTFLLCIVALIGSTGIGILTARWITKPILRLNTAAKDIAQGQWDKPIDIERTDEVGELAESFNQMAAHLQQSFAELNSLNQALAQRESQLRKFLDAVPVGISIYEATGKVLYFNGVAQHFLGLDTIPDAVTENCAERYQIYRQNQLCQTEELPVIRSLRGETVFVDDLELQRDGLMIPFEARSTPIFDEQGNIIYCINVFADITQRKQAEQLIANYYHALEAQVAERTAELARTNEQLQDEIAERKMIEGKLYSSTQLFRTIFESIPDLVLIIDELKTLQIIPTKTLGLYSCDTNLLSAIVDQFFQEGTEEIWFAQIQQVVETQQTVNFDYSLRINEREVWFTACISPLPDNSVVWVARDISDRKQAEESLRRYERIVSATADAVSLVNRNYVYQLVNHTYLTWHNKQYEEIIGHSVSDILGAEVFERLIKEPFDRGLTGETAHYQNWFELAVGRRFLSVTYSPYFETDQTISGVVVSLRDITELKHVEERLWQSNQEMQAIFAAFPDILFCVAADGMILDYKTKDDNNLYTSPARFLNQKVQEILPPPVGQKIYATVRQVLQTDSPVSLEYSLPMPEGEQYFEARMVRFQETEVIAVTRNISDRKLAEERLRQSEAQLNTIVTTTSDGIMILDREGIVRFANPAATELFNLSLDEFMGYQWGIPVGEMAEIEVVVSSGDIRIVEMKATPTQWLGESAYVLALRDISDRKRAETALRESIQREHAIAQVLQRMRQSLDISAIFSATTEELRQVINCDRIAIYQFNPDWSGNFVAESVANGWKTLLIEQQHQPHLAAGILDSSNCGIRSWGVTNEPIQDTYLQTTQGKTYKQGVTYLASADIYNTGLSPCHVQLLERFEARAYLIVPIFCRNKLWGLLAAYHNSEPRDWSESEINTVVQIGTQLGVALQQAQLLEETRQQSAALQKAVEAADAANRAKSAFLANMSHELRTPLNGIMGYAQVLQLDKNCTPNQKEGADIIYQCSTHLLTLINDILDLSKIEADKLELFPEDIYFPSFLAGISEIFNLKAQQKEINFIYLPLNELPTIIHADEKRLRQVLMNLLSNAVKFTETGSVTFKIEGIGNRSWGIGNQRQITNTQHPTPNTQIRFQIEDTGIGINPEQLEKIFLPFEQVGDSLRRAEGTGLGLTISQKLVEMMGSHICVESTPGVGSVFWFDLTLSDVLISPPPRSITSSDRIIGYSGSRRKILIVDDRWENRAPIVQMLEPIGFELLEAATGQEGLEKAIEFQPDLILADLIMPVMDGFEMTRRLRQLPEFQHTIVIAISASVFAAYQQNSRESGCQDFLPKPIQVEDLLNKIKNYLNLSWIYGNRHETLFRDSGNNKLGSYPQHCLAEMVIPSSEELQALYEAAISADVEEVEQTANQLKQLNPDYIPFATRILELAKEFDYEEIANLVERQRSQQSK
ncbi:MAG TPA: PAS domain-containing protein [Allocoleopsis sp.]